MEGFRLFAATGDRVARIDTADGNTFKVSYFLEDLGVLCVSVDPHDRNRVVAGTNDDGVYLSEDSGATWKFIGAAIQHRRTPSVAISAAHRVNGKSVIYVGTEPSRLYCTVDNGASWEDFPALANLPSSSTWSYPPRPWTHHTRWITPHATNPDILYVGIELGGVMRTIDGGRSWEDRKPGAYTDSHAIRIHPTATERVYEAAGQGVAMSTDEGVSWSPVDEGMDRHYAWGIAVDPADPDLWYVSASHGARYAHARNGNAQGHIYRKRGERPFELLDGDLDNPLASMPYSLLTLHGRTGVVLAGMQHGELMLSEDAGDSWRRLNVSLPGLLQLDEAVAH